MHLQKGRQLLAGMVVAGCLAMACTATAGATEGTSPAAVPQPPVAGSDAIQAPWREYFAAVRAAQRIDDPMARCLEWPDLPGSRLPEGNVEAHCRYHYTPMPTPAEVEAHLDAGTVGELEVVLEARFAAHHGAADPDESVHLFYNVFAVLARNDADAADRITRRWLEAVPDSAHANLARARVLETWGWKARGGRYAEETSREQFAAMEEHFAQAVPLYLRANELDPRLTDPHARLISIVRSGRGGDFEDWAVQQATLLVPGCQEVASEYLLALQPKWGGSFDAMMAYVRSLEPAMAAAPLLANQRAAPYVAVIDAAHRAGSYTAEAAAAVDEAVLQTTNDEMFRLAAAVAFHRTDGSPANAAAGAAYLLQRLRFNELSSWEHIKLAEYVINHDRAWALAFAEESARLAPESRRAQLMLAVAKGALGRHAEAERHYRVASEDPEIAETSLSGVIWLWASAGLADNEFIDRIEPYLDELLERFPANGQGRAYDIVRRAMRGRLLHTDVEAFLATADPGDPVQATVLEWLQAGLAGNGEAAPEPGPGG